MRKAFRWLFIRSNTYKNNIRHAWNRINFVKIESLYLEGFKLGKGCIFHAPIKIAGGRGKLIIEGNNGFGYDFGPKIGNGAILIQPRKKKTEIKIGKKNWFNNNVTIIANERIDIGNYCRIGDGVGFFDCDFHELDPNNRGRSHGLTAPISIGDNVWIGSKAMVLKGVTIGENSVVGAMSIVTKSVPSNCIVAGNPARIIGHL